MPSVISLRLKTKIILTLSKNSVFKLSMLFLLTASCISWHEEISNLLVTSTSANFISVFSNEYSGENTQNIPSACFKLSSLKHFMILELNDFYFQEEAESLRNYLFFQMKTICTLWLGTRSMVIRLNRDYLALICKQILCSLNFTRETEHAVFNFCTSLKTTLVLSLMIINASVTANAEL